MPQTDRLILVIDRDRDQAEHLKELIEFMDAPEVKVATAKDWGKSMGKRRLAAVFLGPALSDKEVHEIMENVGEVDPNTPIVKVDSSGKPA